jgi:general L-amino acid transport system permease protein
MAINEDAGSAPARAAFHNDPKVRAAFYQIALFVLVAWAGYEFVTNARENLSAQNIATGFGFLNNTAGFSVNQTLIPYNEADTYARVFWVGLLNTLLVAALGIVCATIIGFTVGIARLSSNWLVARLAGAYVELIRNLPLLFQILFWYLAVLGTLPNPRGSVTIPSFAFGWPDPLQLALFVAVLGIAFFLAKSPPRVPLPAAAFLQRGAAALLVLWAILRVLPEVGLMRAGDGVVFLNNRGVFVPAPVFEPGSGFVGLALLVGLAAALAVAWRGRQQRQATGKGGVALPLVIAIAFGPALLALIVTGFPVRFDMPQLRGFNFAGGIRVIPEFVALLIALSTYTAAFIAEIVRAGVLAVSHGQTEAAYSLGLRPGPTLRLIVVPQAMRVIIPPLTSQYLNLTKNSSLAVGIGYPDLVAVFAGTTLNQTGQAIEIIAMTMAVYLLISLVTSLFMNWYNARVRLVER